ESLASQPAGTRMGPVSPGAAGRGEGLPAQARVSALRARRGRGRLMGALISSGVPVCRPPDGPTLRISSCSGRHLTLQRSLPNLAGRMAFRGVAPLLVVLSLAWVPA